VGGSSWPMCSGPPFSCHPKELHSQVLGSHSVPEPSVLRSVPGWSRAADARNGFPHCPQAPAPALLPAQHQHQHQNQQPGRLGAGPERKRPFSLRKHRTNRPSYSRNAALWKGLGLTSGALAPVPVPVRGLLGAQQRRPRAGSGSASGDRFSPTNLWWGVEIRGRSGAQNSGAFNRRREQLPRDHRRRACVVVPSCHVARGQGGGAARGRPRGGRGRVAGPGRRSGAQLPRIWRPPL